jgi:hypothetical protein
VSVRPNGLTRESSDGLGIVFDVYRSEYLRRLQSRAQWLAAWRPDLDIPALGARIEFALILRSFCYDLAPTNGVIARSGFLLIPRHVIIKPFFGNFKQKSSYGRAAFASAYDAANILAGFCIDDMLISSLFHGEVDAPGIVVEPMTMKAGARRIGQLLRHGAERTT